MSIFHEMKKYQTNESGNIVEMSIPLKPNDDGMIGRECPNNNCGPKYFQIGLHIPEGFLQNDQDLSNIDITCPYCGTVNNMQKYHTEEHTKWIKSMIRRDVAISVQKMLEGSIKNFKPVSNSIVSINMSFKPGPLPNVRYYTEEKLKRKVSCDNCGFQYAVYGISFHCPFCGKGNLILHLNRNVEITRVLIEESTKLRSEHGSDVAQRMIGNALEDVVGIFEGFQKSIYLYGIHRNFSKDDADKKEERVHVSFQRLENAKKLFIDDLKYDIFSQISEEDRLFLEEQFLKRHVLTHNLGLVDEKYLEKAHNYLKQGSELEILPNDVSRFLEIVATIVEKTSQQIINEK
jgi:phage FluMu protein Com